MTTLVMLPGLDGTGLLFGPLLEALAGRLRTTVVSYPHDRVLGYDRLAAWVESALPVAGPLVLLGESFAGPLAVALAARHPGRVRGLVLCNTFVRNPRPLLGLGRPLVRWLPLRRAPLGLLASMLFGRFDTPPLRRLLADAVGSVATPVLQARLRAVIDVDARAALAQVACPVLLLRSDEDVLVPGSAGRLLQRLHPAAETVRLRGPHALLQTAPDEAAKLLVAFAAESVGRAAA